MARSTTSKLRTERAKAFGGALASRNIGQVLGAVIDRIEDDRKQEMRLEAKRTEAERAMLAEDLERLVKKHGDGHPRVLGVKAALASIERQARYAEATVRRFDTITAPAFGGWTAAGRVLDENGKPVVDAEVGFIVTTTGQGGLEPTKTGEDGEFYATYPADIVKGLAESNAQFSLIVRLGRTIVYRDEATFALQPNAIRQFRVDLKGTTAPPKG